MGWKKSFAFLHIPAGTPGSVQVATGPGVLHAVTFNTVGSTPLQATISDGIVGGSLTTIGMILPTVSTSVVPSTALLDLRFNVGLVIAILGANTQDLTVSYET